MATFRRQGRSAAAGTVLILGLTALALLIVCLAGIQRAMRPTYRIHVLLPDAPRVRSGTPVTVAGVTAGRVTHIALAPVNGDSAAKAALTLELASAVRPQVRRDSDVHLRRRRLIGDPFVDLVPGSSTAAVLPPGDTLRGRIRPGPQQALARARELAPAVDSLLRSARGLAAAWDGTRAAAAELSQRAAAAQAELRTLSRSYRAGPLARLMEEGRWRAALGRTRSAAAEIRSLFRNGDASNGAAALGPDLARLAASADSLAHEFARLEAALTAPAALPGRLARDTALTRALRAARAELDSLVAETRRNPLRFFF